MGTIPFKSSNAQYVTGALGYKVGPSSNNGKSVYFDQVLIRNWTPNEPSWATPGSEAGALSPIKLYSAYLSVAGVTESSGYTKVKFMSDSTVQTPLLTENSGMAPVMKIYSGELEVKEIREAS